MSLESAIQLAVIAHKGQKDQAGEAYILHPLRVLFAVRERGSTEEEQIAAVLHDVVEDTIITLRGIAYEFGPEVSRLVNAVTRRPAYTAQWTPNLIGRAEEPYPDFIQRVIAAGPSAMLIKEIDVTDNLRRIDPIRAIDPKKADRLERKYKSALVQLWAAQSEVRRAKTD